MATSPYPRWFPWRNTPGVRVSPQNFTQAYVETFSAYQFFMLTSGKTSTARTNGTYGKHDHTRRNRACQRDPDISVRRPVHSDTTRLN